MRRSGFTLIEVLVALVVGAIVLAGAHQVLAILTDQAHALTRRAAEGDREANGERTLRALVGQLELGSPGTIPFSGTPDTVRFSSWCEAPAGWLERCPVTLSFAADGDHETLRAEVGAQPPLELVSGFRRGTFRYLESAAAGGQWFQQWGTGITAPLGIGVVLVRDHSVDTMLVRIGPRG
ncbi:MAG TPA: prepilin-type N-terminal cleavage/methylation domain-containing protein [Gemmatimonadaceae bacterium]|nr:prepilin-type N-terminal cleavage/methylation domain-containing protein [Gemmatimonadaceae bacterium]